MRPRLPGIASPSRAKARSQSPRRVHPTVVPGKRLRGCFSSVTRCHAADDFLFQLALFSLRRALSGAVALERCAVSGFRLDDVAVFGRNGVDAEVPDAEVDGFVGDDLHESELAEVEGFFGGDFEPVPAGEEFGRGFDDVLLAFPCAEQGDAEAVDDAGAFADVGADDDVTAGGGAASGVVLNAAGGAVSVDGEGGAGGVAYALVADADVEDGVFDVELDGRGLAFERDDRVGG